MPLTLRTMLALVAALAFATVAHAAWGRFDQPAYGFSADFPTTPKEETSMEDGVKIHTFVGGDSSGFCIVIFAEYPYVIDPNVELVASRDNFVKGVSAQLTTNKRITFPRGSTKLAALAFDAASDKTNFRSLLVIEGSGAYQVAAGVPKNGGDATVLERCVGGFKLPAKN